MDFRLLSQVVEAGEAISKAVEGRSDAIFMFVVCIALVCFVLWMFDRRQSKEDAQSEGRESYYRSVTDKMLETNQVISDSTKHTADAVEAIVSQNEKAQMRLEKMENTLFEINKKLT